MKYPIKRIGIILAVAAQVAIAAPTLSGPTGLIEMPTAESLKYKEFNLGIDYIAHSEDAALDQLFYKVNLGTFKGWEIGVVGGDVPTEGVFVNAKYYLMSDQSRHPLSLAIGLENLASQNDTRVYLVASKRFKGGFVGHFGFRAEFEESDVDASVMVGAEHFFTNQLSILGDLAGENGVYVFNSGARFYWNDFLAVGVSVLDIADSKGQGASYSLGISISRFL